MTATDTWTATAGNITITTAGAATIDGHVTTATSGDITVRSTNALTITDMKTITSAGGLDIVSGSIASGTATIMTADEVKVTGAWIAAGSLTVASTNQGIALYDDVVTTQGNLTLISNAATGVLVLDGTRRLTASGAMSLRGSFASTAAATINATRELNVKMTDAWSASAGTLSFITDNAMFVDAHVRTTTSGDIAVQSVGPLTLANAASFTSAETATFTCGSIVSSAATVAATKAIAVTGAWTATGTISVTSHEAGVTLNSDLTTTGGASRNIHVNSTSPSGVLTLTGTRVITSSGGLAVLADSVVSAATKLAMTGAASIRVTDTWTATAGDFEVDGGATVLLDANLTTATSGNVTITSVGALTITDAKTTLSAGTITATSASIGSGAATWVSVGAMVVTAPWRSLGHVSMTSTNAGVRLGSDITTTGVGSNLVIVSNAAKGTFELAGSRVLEATGAMLITADSIKSEAATLNSTYAMTLTGAWTATGTIAVTSHGAGVTLNSDLTTTGGASRNIHVNSMLPSGVLTLTGTRVITSSGGLVVIADSVVSAATKLAMTGAASIRVTDTWTATAGDFEVDGGATVLLEMRI